MLLVAVDERGGGRMMIAQACARSQRAGVRTGMTLAHARALLPTDVVTADDAPDADARALEGLARWAMRFTPVVAPDPPTGLLLDVTGCERLFGGERRLLHQVMTAMRELGFTARASIAPTVGAAWAMARCAGSAASIVQEAELHELMERLPVAALRIDAQAAEALADVGIEHVGELLSLPRESLMERFGVELLRRLDQALGRVHEAVEPLRPHEPVQASQAFDGPVLKLEAVQQTVRRLIETLCDQLRQREAGVRRLVMHTERIDADDLAETLRLTRPTRDARHLWALLQPRVERLHLGHGVERLTLNAAAMSRLPAEQLTAWHNGSGEQGEAALHGELAELVDRLVARLGDGAVTRMEPVATHVPERAFAHRPIRDARSAAGEEPLPDTDRPTRLLARPEPVQVVSLSPDGPVASMQRGGVVHGIVASIGPERITPRWWLAPPGRTPAPRDYFIVQDSTGRWWWLYREAERGRWYLHGQWQ